MNRGVSVSRRGVRIVLTALVVAAIGGLLLLNREPANTVDRSRPLRGAGSQTGFTTPPASAWSNPPSSSPVTVAGPMLREHPIGLDQTRNHLRIAALWHRAVPLAGGSKPKPGDIHLLAKIEATEGSPNGFAGRLDSVSDRPLHPDPQVGWTLHEGRSTPSDRGRRPSLRRQPPRPRPRRLSAHIPDHPPHAGDARPIRRPNRWSGRVVGALRGQVRLDLPPPIMTCGLRGDRAFSRVRLGVGTGRRTCGRRRSGLLVPGWDRRGPGRNPGGMDRTPWWLPS